jgi:hypothetical protein
MPSHPPPQDCTLHDNINDHVYAGKDAVQQRLRELAARYEMRELSDLADPPHLSCAKSFSAK